MPDLKKCTVCGVKKPRTQEHYTVSRLGKRGPVFRGECRPCYAKLSRARRSENPERARAIKRACDARHKEKYSGRLKERRVFDPAWAQKKRDQCIAWRLANPDKRWELKYPERARAKRRMDCKIRYHRVRAASGTFTKADIENMFRLQGGKCFYCNGTLHNSGDRKTTFHIDHKLPVSRGGSNEIENLCLACPTCNSRKGAKTAEEFREYAGVSAVPQH